MPAAPPFDPTKPFTVEQPQTSAPPPFDPNKPFTVEAEPGTWDYAKKRAGELASDLYDVGKQIVTSPVRVAEGAATWPAQVLGAVGSVLPTGDPERAAEQKKIRELAAEQGGAKGVAQYLPEAKTPAGKYVGTAT